MKQAKQYIRAVVELEFDEGDIVSDKTVFVYLQELYWNQQLCVQYYDADGNEHLLRELTTENKA
jgi:hypothetical protein